MRFAKNKFQPNTLSRDQELRVGFVPGLESVLLVVAQELGLFQDHGVRVRLCREVGWASVREKIVHEELDAAITPASMLFSIYIGLRGMRRSCLTGLSLGHTANSIILSQSLRDWGVHDAASLASLIRRDRGRRIFSFGVPLELASQHYQFFKWLRDAGINPQREVELSVIPSALIQESLHQGYLNGFIAPPPATTRAVREGSGWIAATPRDLGEPKPESVLLVLQDFAQRRDREHVGLIAALLEASAFCQDASHHDDIIRMLAQSKHLALPESCLSEVLFPGKPSRGESRLPEEKENAKHAPFATRSPGRALGKESLEQLQSLITELPSSLNRTDILSKVFREDLYQQAESQARGGQNRHPGSNGTPPLISAVPTMTGSEGGIPHEPNQRKSWEPDRMSEEAPPSWQLLSI